MKLVIIGTNGNGGSRLLTRAVALGHNVTAVVRGPWSATPGH